jgi:hypothetical protein
MRKEGFRIEIRRTLPFPGLCVLCVLCGEKALGMLRADE